MQTGNADGRVTGLGGLSDEQLLARLAELVRRGRGLTAELVVHLAEVDERRLYLAKACSSLFVYATRRLGMSEQEAYKRITVARLARRLPVVLDWLVEGHVHLSALCALAPHLTEENVVGLLREASGKSQREIERLIAALNPRPAVVDSVRKLPVRPSASSSTNEPAAARRVQPAEPATGGGLDAADEPPAAGARAVAAAPEAATSAPAVPPAAPRRDPRARVEPLDAETYKIVFSASAALREKIEAARALISHALPGAGLAAVVERALDALLEKERARRFAVGKKPRGRRTPPSGQPGTGTRHVESSGRNPRVPRYVEAEVRRKLVERDGERCTWTDASGNRCSETHFLQIDHIEPWCRGGGRELGQLRLLCAPHNRLEAERKLGRATSAMCRNGRPAPSEAAASEGDPDRDCTASTRGKKSPPWPEEVQRGGKSLPSRSHPSG